MAIDLGCCPPTDRGQTNPEVPVRLLVISHALIETVVQARWRQLAADYNVHVRLAVPRYWRSEKFGEPLHLYGEDVTADRFEVTTFETTSHDNHVRYRLKDLGSALRAYQPHVIFCIHEEGLLAHYQAIVCRWLFCPSAALVYFSMRQLPRRPPLVPLSVKQVLKRLVFGSLWRLTRIGTDAAVVHYPGIERQMRLEGYAKQVLLQTQIGVDPLLFVPKSEAHADTRRRLGLTDDVTVIGTCGRIDGQKGALDLIRAAADLRGNWHLLYVGDGPDRQAVEAYARSKGLEGRLTITGFVSQEQVPTLMHAMDIFVLASRSTSTWVDTFPLVVAQAMMVGLPVVGSDSGAIPFQLDGEGLLVAEADLVQLTCHLQALLDDPAERQRMGAALRCLALSRFSTPALNHQFIQFLRDKVLDSREVSYE